mmetsp:Transcript_12493/g.28581  ORF Transcript_12493/g.28581 Transcript_12493/m.28581 type:complete len:82 (-) Transcript_12493:2094-2339(-)
MSTGSVWTIERPFWSTACTATNLTRLCLAEEDRTIWQPNHVNCIDCILEQTGCDVPEPFLFIPSWNDSTLSGKFESVHTAL